MKNLITITLIAIGFTAFSQGDVEFKAGNFKDDKDGFKIASDAFDKGNEDWELGNAQVFIVKDPELFYWRALKQYEVAYKFNPNSAELNFKMGVCYAHSSYKEKCVSFLRLLTS